jgi:hypothetical protein
VVGLCALLILLVAVVASRATRRFDAGLAGLTMVRGPVSEWSRCPPQGLRGRPSRRTAARTAVLEAAQRRSFQRAVAATREETGGNQSFALALLDAAGDGWVLSSLHARSGTRVYAKAITAGRADTGLSDEETAALGQAMG